MKLRPILLVLPLLFGGCQSGGDKSASSEGEATEVASCACGKACKCAHCAKGDPKAECTCGK